jgi:hypothetical protein
MPKLAIVFVAASIFLPVISGGTPPTNAPAREEARSVRLADFRPLTQLQCRRHVPNVPPKSSEETQFA